MSMVLMTHVLMVAILCLLPLGGAWAQEGRPAPEAAPLAVSPEKKAAEKGAGAQVKAAEEPPALAHPTLYAESFKALFVLFILATLLESGLALLFNWRPFIELFDGRGMKTVVSFVVALVFVSAFNLDIVTRLVNIYSDPDQPVTALGLFVTALVIAGGSSAVNHLFVALGLRAVKTAEKIAPKPPPTEAWLAVRLLRKSAQGPVTVLAGPDGGSLPVAGTIAGSSKNTGLSRFFLRDFGRFPTAGGFRVSPGTATKVQLVGRDAQGQPLQSAVWGPYPLAPGAIVDVDIEL